ncbi:MAG: hypothetical protein GTO14_12765 [Anaerolineales bacterium]|nr:hypothetical protein [Anaerolineales bacterium]
METLLTLSLPWRDVLAQLERVLADVGLEVVQSFNLQSARNSFQDPDLFPCPDHGTSQCACQYMVLLVQQEGLAPLTLEIHGHDDETYISLVHTSSGLMDDGVKDLVQRAIDKLALVYDSPSS